MQDINLLPQSEVIEQTKVKAIKLSTILSAIFLVIVIIASGYILFLNNKTKQEISVLDSEIEGYRSEINSRAAVEVTVRNLDKKHKALQTIFTNQRKYSKLMEELKFRKPETLSLDSADFRKGKININGLADNYIAIADFINNLKNTSFTGGIKGLEGLFTQVSINSVNMENSKNKISFFIVVDFNDELLK